MLILTPRHSTAQFFAAPAESSQGADGAPAPQYPSGDDPQAYGQPPAGYPGAGVGGAFISATEPKKSTLWVVWVIVGVVLLGTLPLLAEQLPPGLREQAEQGDAVAQTELGSRYYSGRGVPQDDAKATRWIRLAAEQGLTHSLQFEFDEAVLLID